MIRFQAIVELLIVVLASDVSLSLFYNRGLRLLTCWNHRKYKFKKLKNMYQNVKSSTAQVYKILHLNINTTAFGSSGVHVIFLILI